MNQYNIITPVNSLQPVYPSGNIPVIRIDNIFQEAQLKIEIIRKDLQEVVIHEKYMPQQGNFILVAIRDLVHRFLQNDITGFQQGEDFGYQQPTASATIKIYRKTDTEWLPETPQQEYFLVKQFLSVKGETAEELFLNAESFFNFTWLTTQPQTRAATENEPIFLSAFIQQNAVLKAKAQHPSTSDVETLQTITGNEYSMFNFNITWQQLMDAFSLNEQNKPIHFELFIEHQNNQVTHPIRISLNQYPHPYMSLFAFENALGGIESIMLYGHEKKTSLNTFLRSVVYNNVEQYETIPLILTNKKISGVQGHDHKLWIADFFDATNRYINIKNQWIPIFIDTYEMQQSQSDTDEYEFTFGLRKQSAGKTPQRQLYMDYIVPE